MEGERFLEGQEPNTPPGQREPRKAGGVLRSRLHSQWAPGASEGEPAGGENAAEKTN